MLEGVLESDPRDPEQRDFLVDRVSGLSSSDEEKECGTLGSDLYLYYRSVEEEEVGDSFQVHRNCGTLVIKSR